MDDAQRMCGLIGVTPAPLVVAGMQSTLRFFREHLRVDPFQWVSYIRGIDFHKPVEDSYLDAGVALSRHRFDGPARSKPFEYFTVPGTSQFRTGTSFDRSIFEKYLVTVRTRALVSIAAAINFYPGDRVSRLGGGKQYILSAADAKRLRRIA